MPLIKPSPIKLPDKPLTFLTNSSESKDVCTPTKTPPEGQVFLEAKAKMVGITAEKFVGEARQESLSIQHYMHALIHYIQNLHAPLGCAQAYNSTILDCTN